MTPSWFLVGVASERCQALAYAACAFALGLLGGVVFLLLRQRRLARAIAQANARLEAAVAQRTANLEAELERRVRLELELRHARRLEAVEHLAAGIAHEINSPIQYVGDSIYFLRQAFSDVMRLVQAYANLVTQTAPPEGVELTRVRGIAEEIDVDLLKKEVPAAFERTAEGTRQVASLVRAMKTFAQPSPEKAFLDVNSAIRNTLIVSRNEYKLVADVETELGHIPEVFCNAGAIRQVLLDLVFNAAQAITEANGSSAHRGSIRITTARRDDRVIIAVADTGSGITEAQREQLFEPAFTLDDHRLVGGLALAHHVVLEHGGKLWFRSELGQGTIFFVELPIDPPAHCRKGAEHAA